MSTYYVLWDTGSYDYPCMEYLKPALVPLMRPILEKLEVEDMGRLLIVNLKPSGHVTNTMIRAHMRITTADFILYLNLINGVVKLAEIRSKSLR